MISENIFLPAYCEYNGRNSLPDYVVDTDNLDKFRTRIDEFWQHQEIYGSRSRFRDTDIEVPSA